jgi:hypothetical protein
MLRRLLHDEILRTLRISPAILLTGARQVGNLVQEFEPAP